MPADAADCTTTAVSLPMQPLGESKRSNIRVLLESKTGHLPQAHPPIIGMGILRHGRRDCLPGHLKCTQTLLDRVNTVANLRYVGEDYLRKQRMGRLRLPLDRIQAYGKIRWPLTCPPALHVPS